MSSSNLLPSSLPLSNEGRVERDIVSGLQQSLIEVKSTKTRKQLTTKHAILIAIISCESTTFGQRQAQALQNTSLEHCQSQSL